VHRLDIARTDGIGSGDYRIHSGMPERPLGVDRDDLGVRPIRTDEVAMELPRQAPVGRKRAGAGHEARVLDPPDGIMVIVLHAVFFAE
jgi:hypothetical protein